VKAAPPTVAEVRANGHAGATAQRVLAGSATVLGSRGVTSAIAVLKGVGVAALVPPATLGVLNFVTTVVMYGGGAQLGIRSAAMRQMLVAEATGDHQTARAVQRAAVNLNVLLVGVCALAAAAAALVGNVSTEVRLGLFAAVPLLFLVTLCQWHEARAIADGSFGAFGGSQIAQAALGAAAVLGGTYLGGLPGLLIGVVVAQAATLALLAAVAPLTLRGGLTRAEATTLLRAGLPFFGGSLAFMLLRSGDNLLVLFFLGQTAWGLYSFALMITMVVVNVVNEVSRVITPSAQRAVADGDGRRLRPYVIPPSLLGAVGVPLLAGIAHHLLPAVVAAVFPRYAPAVALVDLLFVAVFFYVVTVFHGCALMALGREGSLVGLRLLSAAVMLSVGAALLRAGWDLSGVALAGAVGWAVNATPTIVMAARRMGLRGGAVGRYVVALVAPLGYGAAGIVVTALVRPDEPGLAAAAVGALLFAAWYAPSFLWLARSLNARDAMRRRSWASIVVPFAEPPAASERGR
jgi:O-antigen/teichoic acid export membrane protein